MSMVSRMDVSAFSVSNSGRFDWLGRVPGFLACCIFASSLSWMAQTSPAHAQGVISPERKVVLTDSAIKDKSHAQKERLSRLMQDARVLYRNGAYETAIKRFKEAYTLSEDDNVLFNIAISYQQLRDWERCIGFIDRYLETAAQSPRRDRAMNAKQSCSARRQSNQVLQIETSPPGAAIYLQNRKSPIQGYSPFKTRLPVGVQRVWIELAGYEREMRDIEIRRDEPFRLSVVLRKRTDPGWLYVDSTIRDAQVYLDGRALQLTPFPAPLSVSSGHHRLQVKRDGFTQISRQIKINPFLLTRIDAPLQRTSTLTTWRSTTGWVSTSLGILAIVGGALAVGNPRR